MHMHHGHLLLHELFGECMQHVWFYVRDEPLLSLIECYSSTAFKKLLKDDGITFFHGRVFNRVS